MTTRVIVVGGGMVGLAFAIAVRRAVPNASISVLEAKHFPKGKPDALDTRASALNIASREILDSWNVWNAIEPKARKIQFIHVSNQHHFGSSLMSVEDINRGTIGCVTEDTLGFVAENHLIGRAFRVAADGLNIELRMPVQVATLTRDSHSDTGVILTNGEKISADLVIIANGNHSDFHKQLGITVGPLSYKATGDSG